MSVRAHKDDKAPEYGYIVINTNFNAFEISYKCRAIYMELRGENGYIYIGSDIASRSDRHLITAIRKCQENRTPSSDNLGSLQIKTVLAEFCNDKYCKIHDDNGMETLEFNIAQYKLDQLEANADGVSPDTVRYWCNKKIEPLIWSETIDPR